MAEVKREEMKRWLYLCIGRYRVYTFDISIILPSLLRVITNEVYTSTTTGHYYLSPKERSVND